MKEKVWATPNRMVMESGHKTFDRQTNCISTGNVIANTQLSSYIRPYGKTTNPVGEERPPGHLQDFDFGWWSKPPLPGHVRRYIESVTQRDRVIVYQFHHWLSGGYWGQPKRTVHGFVITRPNGLLLRKFVTGPTYKSQMVIEEAALYVSD